MNAAATNTCAFVFQSKVESPYIAAFPAFFHLRNERLPVSSCTSTLRPSAVLFFEYVPSAHCRTLSNTKEKKKKKEKDV